MRKQSIILLLAITAASLAKANSVDIIGPTGSESFGSTVVALKNGNFVVTDPSYSPDNQSYLGAVYLYKSQGELISTLVGSPPYTSIGNLGIAVLPNGNYVVCSSPTNFGPTGPQGSVTLVDGALGLNGVVSSANSLVNFTPDTSSCSDSVIALSDSNYVVRSGEWRDASEKLLGAATYCSGTAGCIGPISAANSLVGSADGDQVGLSVLALHDGKYVVASPFWSTSDSTHVGAITFCGNVSGCAGVVTAANSLVGSQSYDTLGSESLTLLTNGNFVVVSPYWHNPSGVNVGAVTLIDGFAGSIGGVTSENSLLGTNSQDFVSVTVTPLMSGDYVVAAPSWDDAATPDVGAVVLCNGTSGCPSHIGPDDALVGSTNNDRVGYRVVALSNGNYVVGSGYWNDVHGAVTLCEGSVGCAGVVSTTNSLTGSTFGDCVSCDALVALTSGDFVVGSEWQTLGASTWCDGTFGCVGPISVSNSLIGTGDGTQVASAITPLTNGNYVIFNAAESFGLVTATAIVAKGSEVGLYSDSDAFVGIATVTGELLQEWPLPNGNFIIRADYWSGGPSYATGAIALVRGYGPRRETFNSANAVFGVATTGGPLMSFSYNSPVDVLIVGRPADNVVSLLKADQLFFNDFDQ